jgi:hypothetical protein
MWIFVVLSFLIMMNGRSYGFSTRARSPVFSDCGTTTNLLNTILLWVL